MRFNDHEEVVPCDRPDDGGPVGMVDPFLSAEDVPPGTAFQLHLFDAADRPSKRRRERLRLAKDHEQASGAADAVDDETEPSSPPVDRPQLTSYARPTGRQEPRA